MRLMTKMRLLIRNRWEKRILPAYCGSSAILIFLFINRIIAAMTSGTTNVRLKIVKSNRPSKIVKLNPAIAMSNRR